MTEYIMSNTKIPVLIVDDSVLIRKYVSSVINDIPDCHVIATAPNGKIALQKLLLLRPSVIILDLEMPEMNGLQFLAYVKKHPPEYPIHIIVLSSLVGEHSAVTFQALESGAEDFIRKPEGRVADNVSLLRKELDLKIHALFEHSQSLNKLKKLSSTELNKEEQEALQKNHVIFGSSHVQAILEEKHLHPRLFVIGSSTGGPHAIRVLLKTLDPLPVPLVIVQHMPAGFTKEFAFNLADNFQRSVCEIKDNEVLQNGVIYICPGGTHARLNLNEKSEIIFQSDHKQYDSLFFKPSFDLFLSSIQKIIGREVVISILSGMGKDGSLSLPKLRKAGALVFAQDKKSSVVWGMPGMAVKSGGVDAIIPIEELGNTLNSCINYYFSDK